MDDIGRITHFGKISRHFEAENPKPWRMAELGVDGIQRRVPRFAAVEIHVTRLEAKFKMGQDAHPENTAIAVASLEESGMQDLAELMRHCNDIPTR